MSNTKKCGKSKFLNDDLNDFINESQFLKESPKLKKTQKQIKHDLPAAIQEENVSESIDYEPVVKKRKSSLDTSQKVRDAIAQQIESRKLSNDALLNKWSNILKNLDADYTIMKENDQKLEQLTGALLKCIQQTSVAQKQKLKLMWEMHASFKKECEEMNALHKAQNEKLAVEIDEDLKNLEQKLITETKRNGWENLRKTFFHAMQNDL